MALVSQTAQVIRAISRIGQHKFGFVVVAVLVFVVSVGLLAKLDLLPDAPAPKAVAQVPAVVLATSTPAVPEMPLHIEIPDIQLSVTIANPTTTNVAALDEELLHGAVRYPTSAKLGEAGNVIVFGHSSYLPVVNNKAFKAFNDIQKLKVGQKIVVKGETRTYVYTVETVTQANAGKDGIPLTVSGSVLTLATCDSFGTSSDRFIVTARLVESYLNAS